MEENDSCNQHQKLGIATAAAIAVLSLNSKIPNIAH